MRHTYHAEQWLPYPVEVAFAFFSDPANLPRLMPAWQQARIKDARLVQTASAPTTPSGANAAGAGTRLTLSFRPFPFSPIRVSWEAEITEFAWNEGFCDKQLRGPFRYWRHCHRVRPETRTDATTGLTHSGTLLQDEVEYEAPLGLLGDLANRLFLARQLRSTFAYRHTRTLELLRQSRNVAESAPSAS